MQKKWLDDFSAWERETKNGNHYFDSKKFDEAKLNYIHAKKIAIRLFREENDVELAVVALVVSYHNLAELYKRQDELKLAYVELDEVDSYLVACLENDQTNSLRRNAIRRGIDKTRSEILQFIQTNKIKSKPIHITQSKKFQH